MLRPGRGPLRPNWWTILPLLANAALWVGIVYVGVKAKSMVDDRAATAIYADVSTETEASSRRQTERTDCFGPDCSAAPVPGAAAAPSH